MVEPRNWDEKIKADFFNIPGRHLGIFGHSGVGKTQSAFGLVSEFIGRETVVWFDTGKSSDLLRLLDFADINAIIPAGHDIALSYKIPEYEGHILKSFFDTPRDAFKALDTKMINVIMLRPFIQQADVNSIATKQFFDTLILMASRYELPVPMTLFLDEVQFIAPSDGYEFNRKQRDATTTLGHNIDQLRSWQVRLCCLGQDWGKVHRGVRNQLKCLIIRQGVFFYSDAPRLARFNKTWEILAQDLFIFVFSDRFFSDPIPAPFYGDGNEIGTIRYLQ